MASQTRKIVMLLVIIKCFIFSVSAADDGAYDSPEEFQTIDILQAREFTS